jgi:hypothetical protein
MVVCFLLFYKYLIFLRKTPAGAMLYGGREGNKQLDWIYPVFIRVPLSDCGMPVGKKTAPPAEVALLGERALAKAKKRSGPMIDQSNCEES